MASNASPGLVPSAQVTSTSEAAREWRGCQSTVSYVALRFAPGFAHLVKSRAVASSMTSAVFFPASATGGGFFHEIGRATDAASTRESLPAMTRRNIERLVAAGASSDGLAKCLRWFWRPHHCAKPRFHAKVLLFISTLNRQIDGGLSDCRLRLSGEASGALAILLRPGLHNGRIGRKGGLWKAPDSDVLADRFRPDHLFLPQDGRSDRHFEHRSYPPRYCRDRIYRGEGRRHLQDHHHAGNSGYRQPATPQTLTRSGGISLRPTASLTSTDIKASSSAWWWLELSSLAA